jgi:hypothetical protein
MLKTTPSIIVPYVAGLLLVAGRATCTKMARRLHGEVSHDHLTRVLHTVRRGGQTLLLRAARRALGELTDGYLIIDDTVIKKAYAKCIDYLGLVHSSKEGRRVWGLCLVVLMWSNGTVTVPIAFRLWKPGSTTRPNIALDLLKWAKKRGIKPKYVLFDSFYAYAKLLKWCERQGWYFVGQIKKNRKLNDIQVKRWHCHPYWTEDGMIDGGLTVRIVRHGKKYFVTNDLSLTSRKVRQLYADRWDIETAFRLLHDQLSMDTCQAQSVIAQTNHIRYCCLAYLVITTEAAKRNITPYQLKEDLIFERERWDMGYVEKLLAFA